MTLDQAKTHAKGIIARNPKVIQAALDEGCTPMQALRVAVEHEQALLRELIDNKTDRARAMREEIANRTWEALRAQVKS